MAHSDSISNSATLLVVTNRHSGSQGKQIQEESLQTHIHFGNKRNTWEDMARRDEGSIEWNPTSKGWPFGKLDILS